MNLFRRLLKQLHPQAAIFATGVFLNLVELISHAHARASLLPILVSTEIVTLVGLCAFAFVARKSNTGQQRLCDFINVSLLGASAWFPFQIFMADAGSLPWNALAFLVLCYGCAAIAGKQRLALALSLIAAAIYFSPLLRSGRSMPLSAENGELTAKLFLTGRDGENGPSSYGLFLSSASKARPFKEDSVGARATCGWISILPPKITHATGGFGLLVSAFPPMKSFDLEVSAIMWPDAADAQLRIPITTDGKGTAEFTAYAHGVHIQATRAFVDHQTNTVKILVAPYTTENGVRQTTPFRMIDSLGNNLDVGAPLYGFGPKTKFFTILGYRRDSLRHRSVLHFAGVPTASAGLP